jgi:ubiquitin-protein ligase
MSWNFSVVSPNKDRLKQEIGKQQYCPPKLIEMLCDQVDQIKIPEWFALSVNSSGHHDSNYAYGDFKLNMTKLP